MPSITIPKSPPVDISDRSAAVDRYARLSIISGLLDDLSGFTDFLDELPRGWNHADKGANAVGEMCELFEALWPEEWENNGPVENMEAEARTDVMVARLLLNLAASSDWLRERAAERLAMADGELARAAVARATKAAA